MKWVGWVLNALQDGGTPRDLACPGGDEALHAEVVEAVEAVEALAALDAEVGRALLRLERREWGRTALGGRFAELLRRTGTPAGRMGLALCRVPSEGRPDPDEAVPAAMDDWLPLLPPRLRRFWVFELAVHVLAAEVRARRARTVAGASRPQDLHAVLLVFREDLRHPGRRRNPYMELSRQEIPEIARSLKVAVCLLRSSLGAGPSRRFYRTPEIVLSLVEAGSASEAERSGLGGARRRTALALDLQADALADGCLTAHRAAEVTRRARDRLAPPFGRGREVAWAWAREALEANVDAAVALEAAGLSSRARKPQEELERHRIDGPAGTPVETSWERARYAVECTRRAASELKTLADEASAAAVAAATAEPGPGRSSQTIAHLRTAMGIA